VKVGDLVIVVPRTGDSDEDTGIIVAPAMTGLWMVLIDSVVHQLLERELEVVCESG
jgi:hypothetical protein